MALPAGVPQLLNAAAWPQRVGIQVRAASKALARLLGIQQEPEYGLFQNGQVKLKVDGYVDFNMTQNSILSTYRIEDGSFATFNKVQTPWAINAVAIKTGTHEELGQFLQDLDAIQNDIQLYDFYAKDQIYTNCNLETYSYRRNTKNGANILFVELSIKQIMMTTPNVTVPATKETAGQPVVNVGTVTAK